MPIQRNPNLTILRRFETFAIKFDGVCMCKDKTMTNTKKIPINKIRITERTTIVDWSRRLFKERFKLTSMVQCLNLFQVSDRGHWICQERRHHGRNPGWRHTMVHWWSTWQSRKHLWSDRIKRMRLSRCLPMLDAIAECHKHTLRSDKISDGWRHEQILSWTSNGCERWRERFRGCHRKRDNENLFTSGVWNDLWCHGHHHYHSTHPPRQRQRKRDSINQSTTPSHLNVSKWRQQLRLQGLETSRVSSLIYVFFSFFLYPILLMFFHLYWRNITSLWHYRSSSSWNYVCQDLLILRHHFQTAY